MKKTEVIWIDDKTSDFENVVNNIFSDLWDEGIRSNVYIVEEKENYNFSPEENIDCLNNIIVQTFVNYLISKNIINDYEKTDRLYSLINRDGAANVDDFVPKSNIVQNKSEFFKMLNREIEDTPEQDLEKFFCAANGFDDNRIIMIDMCLLPKDYFELVEKKESVLLSMLIYKHFKNRGFPTYIYTTHTNPKDLIEQWKKIYSTISTDESTVMFFKRTGDAVDTSGDTSSKLLKDIIIEDVKRKDDTKDSRKTND